MTPYYSLARVGDELVGVLLYFIQVQSARPLLSFLSSRSIIWGGPVTKVPDCDIVEGLLHYYKSSKPSTIYTQVRNLVDTSSYRDVFRKFDYTYEEHLTILVDLTRSEDELWKGVYPKRRNQIRRARKEGCTVGRQTTVAALRACYSILEEVYSRAKLPLPALSHFEALLRFADDRSGLRVFTVTWQDQIIGCMLCLAYGDQLFDYYAGAYSAHYKKYPNDLLPWEVFMWARKHNFSLFDFGGAGKPGVPYGVRDYKKQFGGTLVSHGRYEKPHFPYLFRLFKKMFEFWQQYSR
ncbi:lipid II:glycine glycyltransferase FemX [Spirosoma rigui]|uniref:lipid II:glycine glycyltransferase FemX n=1 Tax=Spirosoma rigui TaxID=564064 RepID=UPI0014751CB4|nr:GNAT family N-acetyltransferase [Spirosoma rigui]